MDFQHSGLATEEEMYVADDIAEILREKGEYRRVSAVTDAAEIESQDHHGNAHFWIETGKDIEYVVTVTRR